MAHLDYKATVWFRIKLYSEETDINEVINNLNKGRIPYDSVVIDSEDEMLIECDALLETETYIHPVDNDDMSTVEIYSDKGELIWQNGN